MECWVGKCVLCLVGWAESRSLGGCREVVFEELYIADRMR